MLDCDWFSARLFEMVIGLSGVQFVYVIARGRVELRINFNFLLTEREGRTGEYWPEVVAVRTERSETEGQYSSVRSRASEVSK